MNAARLSKYLLVPHLSGPTFDAVNHYRQEHNPTGFRRSPAHLTLIPPFNLKTDADTFTVHLHSFIQQQRYLTFPLTIEGIDAKFPKKDLVVLKLASSSDLAHIHSALAEFVQEHITFAPGVRVYRDFRPHLTLLTAHTREEWREHQERVQTFAHQQIDVSGLELWHFTGERWETINTIRFNPHRLE